MMNVGLGPFEKEEAVVINLFGSTVQVEECGDIAPVLVVDQLLSYQYRYRM
jgi:hypothetical protein